MLSKYFVSRKASTIFLKDLVPDWTAIPEGLLITIKFSLSSIIKSSYLSLSLFVGTYWVIMFFSVCLILSILKTSTISFSSEKLKIDSLNISIKKIVKSKEINLVIPNSAIQNGADAIVLYQGTEMSFPNGTEIETENIIDAIVDAYLGKEERHYSFKTDRYQLMGSLLENTKYLHQ